MKSVTKSLAKWLKENFCTNPEVYLSQSRDRADFEYRLRRVENRISYSNQSYLPIYFV